MRRRIELYINGQRVDLADDALVLMNWRAEDLSNPTTIRNSHSQQLTLPGTSGNNRLFGSAFRPDRISGTGFNPSKRAPYAIYDEAGEILESGYAKLDSVTRRGSTAVSWSVTLYGGLGDFFQSLAYDAGGNKRSLADLDYLGTGAPEDELNFQINAANVLAAWATAQDGSVDALWKVINFAPALNGIPGSDFSADKALADPSAFGLPSSVGGYTLKDGYALFNLPAAVDEWAVKDLRSYLQRPVFSMRAFWEAVCDPANNGGYSVDASEVLASPYADTWLTLPLLPSLPLLRKGVEAAVTLTSDPTTDETVGEYIVSGAIPTGSTVTASLHVIPIAEVAAASGYDTLLTSVLNGAVGRHCATFIWAVGYDGQGNVAGYSNTACICDTNDTPAQLAAAFGLSFPGSMDSLCYIGTWDRYEGDGFAYNEVVDLTLAGQNLARVELMQTVVTFRTVNGGIDDFTATGQSAPTLYGDYSTPFPADSVHAEQGEGDEVTVAGAVLRSGARITKRMLLTTGHTPADYLLAFCKVFGFIPVYDPAAKSVTVMSRNTFFTGEVLDFSRRVDMGQDRPLAPFAFDAKWYRMSLESVGGAFADEYGGIYGVPYGIQRIDTGYDFNADEKALLEKLPFRSAASVLNKSRYLNIIHAGGEFQPSPFVDSGVTYTLWNTAGETQEQAVSCPPASSSVAYYNVLHGYDANGAVKAEFRDADNAPVDGAGVLLLKGPDVTMPYFHVTDDLPAMDDLNEGRPCWRLEPGSPAGLAVPAFSTVRISGGVVDLSLDMGAPRELGIPGVVYDEDAPVYARRWRAYLRDRYDDDSKVLRCRVDLAGLQVGPELLRRFAWFGGCIWAINAIGNHSLTTFDTAEVELVQVRDTDNYTQGQI